MLRALLRRVKRGRGAPWLAPRAVWKLRLRLDPGVVYVAAESATDAVERACARLGIQPDHVVSAEMYAPALDSR